MLVLDALHLYCVNTLTHGVRPVTCSCSSSRVIIRCTGLSMALVVSPIGPVAYSMRHALADIFVQAIDYIGDICMCQLRLRFLSWLSPEYR